MTKQQHDNIVKSCDQFLVMTFGIGWNDLADCVSVWDWAVGDETGKKLERLVKDICWEKLVDDYPDRCEMTEMIYGDCSCFKCDAPSEDFCEEL